jgi:hypothetical protein
LSLERTTGTTSPLRRLSAQSRTLSICGRLSRPSTASSATTALLPRWTWSSPRRTTSSKRRLLSPVRRRLRPCGVRVKIR